MSDITSYKYEENLLLLKKKLLGISDSETDFRTAVPFSKDEGEKSNISCQKDAPLTITFNMSLFVYFFTVIDFSAHIFYTIRFHCDVNDYDENLVIHLFSPSSTVNGQ